LIEVIALNSPVGARPVSTVEFVSIVITVGLSVAHPLERNTLVASIGTGELTGTDQHIAIGLVALVGAIVLFVALQRAGDTVSVAATELVATTLTVHSTALLVPPIVTVDDAITAPFFGKTFGLTTRVSLTGIGAFDAPADRRAIGLDTIRVGRLYVIDVTRAAVCAIIVAATDGQTLGADGQKARLFAIRIVATFDNALTLFTAEAPAENVIGLTTISVGVTLTLGNAVTLVLKIDLDALGETRIGVRDAIGSTDRLI